jgi:alpha-L-rhamnosidase
MGDAQIACETMLLNFDAASTYIKWLQDMRDDQRADGAIGDTTPYTIGRRGGDLGWGCAILIVAWYVYVFTGDRRVLETHYPAMKKYLGYLDKTYPARIVDNSIYGGDWLHLEETPHPVTNTGYFLLGARIMAQCASVLGRETELRQYAALEAEIACCFQKKLFSRETGQYGNGSQFSNAWPLYLNIVPDELKQSVFSRLVENIEKRNRHLSTGFLGTRYLLEVLCDYGRADLAYAIVTAEDYPGWGYMRKHQATTLWEHWELKTGNGMNSHNHPCFCSAGSWLMKYLAGIRPDPARPGFRHIQIAPVFPEELAFAEGELQTVRGVVRSSWRRKGKEIALQVVIPAGCSAELQVPKQMKILGRPLEPSGSLTANDFPAGGSLAPGTTRMRIGCN